MPVARKVLCKGSLTNNRKITNTKQKQIRERLTSNLKTMNLKSTILQNNQTTPSYTMVPFPMNWHITYKETTNRQKLLSQQSNSAPSEAKNKEGYLTIDLVIDFNFF